MKFIARQKIFEIEERPLLMGILNVTPDSFYDGGRYTSLDSALERAERMLTEGADIIDVGGESTRPGSKPIGIDEEKRRVLPVVENLVSKLKAVVSVDTYKPEVARAALESGASIINDIFALRYKDITPDGKIVLTRDDELGEMSEVVREFSSGVILMHIKGTPLDMQKTPPQYEDVVLEIKKFLKHRHELAVSSGIASENIAIDPGIGFGKQPIHNVEIIKRLNEFTELNCPLLVGASRKSFLGAMLGAGNQRPEDRLGGTLAAHFISYLNGARILRVHDIKEHRDFFETYIKMINKNTN